MLKNKETRIENEKFKCLIVGCGNRSRLYAENAMNISKDFEIVGNREIFAKKNQRVVTLLSRQRFIITASEDNSGAFYNSIICRKTATSSPEGVSITFRTLFIYIAGIVCEEWIRTNEKFITEQYRTNE